jgi:hypothetical protein
MNQQTWKTSRLHMVSNACQRTQACPNSGRFPAVVRHMFAANVLEFPRCCHANVSESVFENLSTVE